MESIEPNLEVFGHALIHASVNMSNHASMQLQAPEPVPKNAAAKTSDDKPLGVRICWGLALESNGDELFDHNFRPQSAFLHTPVHLPLVFQ